MKREAYMSKNELLDFLKVGVLAGETEAIAERTPEKDWRQKLKTMSTYAKKILDERLAVLDKKQLETVSRRKDHTELVLYTSDQRRLNSKNDDKIEESITIGTEDLYDVVDMALLSCMKCPQGDVCRTCNMREVFHRIGVPPVRTNPEEGECEFRTDNEIKCVTPQYKRISERM